MKSDIYVKTIVGEYLTHVLNESTSNGLISKEREVELFQELERTRTENPERATDIEHLLVNSNLKFIIYMAKKYWRTGMDMNDLFQYGVLGFMHAIRKFDWRKGYRLTTYSGWWISNYIIRENYSASRMIRVTDEDRVLFNKVNRFMDEYRMENDGVPLVGDIAQALDISIEQVQKALKDAMFHPVSIDQLLSDGTTLAGTIEAPEDDVLETIYTENIRDGLSKFIDMLTKRQSDTVRMYYGIGCEPMSTEQIARTFGVSGKRVRQILDDAKWKLKGHRTEMMELIKE